MEDKERAEKLTEKYSIYIEDGVLCVDKKMPVEDFIFIKNYYKDAKRIKNVLVNWRQIKRNNKNFTI